MKKRSDIFQEGLERYLRKCELEYRAKWLPGGSCVEWLEPYCGSTGEIVGFLRDLGFRIRRVVDEETTFGDRHQWVVASGDVIVFVNTPWAKGFVIGTAHDR